MGFEGEGRGDAMKGRGGDEREDERLRGSGKWRGDTERRGRRKRKGGR